MYIAELPLITWQAGVANSELILKIMDLKQV
jgi:hypothetical protein